MSEIPAPTLITPGRAQEAASLLRRALLIREARCPTDDASHHLLAATRSELGGGLAAHYLSSTIFFAELYPAASSW